MILKKLVIRTAIIKENGERIPEVFYPCFVNIYKYLNIT